MHQGRRPADFSYELGGLQSDRKRSVRPVLIVYYDLLTPKLRSVTPVPDIDLEPVPSNSTTHTPGTRTSPRKRARQNHSQNDHLVPVAPPAPPAAPPLATITPMNVSSLIESQQQHQYPYGQVYAGVPRAPAPAPPQTWQASGAIAPQQTHLAPPPMPHMLHRPHDAWSGYDHAHAASAYDYRYREDHTGWVPGPQPYYEPPVCVFLSSRDRC